jgi:hypothetical protein
MLLIGAVLLTGCSTPVNPPISVPTTLAPTTAATTIPSPTLEPTETITATATEVPSPTQVPERYSMADMQRIPKSEAAIATSCVEVASPIDNPDQYSTDMDAYLKVFHEQIIPNWQGAVIKGDKNWLGITGQQIYFANGAMIEPAACARFKYQGKDVVMMSFVAEDDNGKFAINIIIDPLAIARSSISAYGSPDEILPQFPVKLMDHLGNGKKVQFFTACDVYTGTGAKNLTTQFAKDY